MERSGKGGADVVHVVRLAVAAVPTIHQCNRYTRDIDANDNEEDKQDLRRRTINFGGAAAGAPIRVVEIAGVDKNTCCGTHVSLRRSKCLWSPKGSMAKPIMVWHLCADVIVTGD